MLLLAPMALADFNRDLTIVDLNRPGFAGDSNL